MKKVTSPAQRSRRRPLTGSKNHLGLTLVELLVAMALSLLVVLAAVSALVVARQGFSSVDASSQLRDNGRFAAGIMQRLLVQSGFLDFSYAINTAASEFKLAGAVPDPEPSIRGVNNAMYTQSLALGNTATSPANGVNGSDMLVLRYQIGETAPGSNKSDNTMIYCNGDTPKNTIAQNANDRIWSVFHVAVNADTKEPSLMCTWRDDASGNWYTQPLVQGIETMQVLYGVDGVTPGAAPTGATDSVPERYLRADQLNAPTVQATNENWRRVRSVRIGLVLRGPEGSSAQRNVPAQYPLGRKDVMNTADDIGSEFTAKTDGRLRQTVTFTVHLRNSQNM
jgi:type IV pilus assembly protein PilW